MHSQSAVTTPADLSGIAAPQTLQQWTTASLPDLNAVSLFFKGRFPSASGLR